MSKTIRNPNVLGVIKYVVSNEPGRWWTIPEIESVVRTHVPNLAYSNVSASLAYVESARRKNTDRFPGAVIVEGKVCWEGDEPYELPAFYRFNEGASKTEEPKESPNAYFFVGITKDGGTLLRDSDNQLWKAERLDV